jgi:hypothetical protein
MDPAVIVLSGIVTVAIGLFVNALRDLRKDLKSQSDNTHSQCAKITERQAVVETKVDMLLDHSGFDMRKVNRAIKDNLDEIKKNDKPSVGCINIKELYREG